jgi:hypothetical protein
MVSASKRRRPIDQKTVDELMFRNRHTCCICHDSSKHVQIHHIDEDRSNDAFDNLAVLCLDCHSRVSADQGLGRRFTTGEIRKYKREWESLNLSKLEGESVTDEVEAAVLRADISRLTVEVISLADTQRRSEALEQIETYHVFFGMRDEALKAISTILVGSVWGDAEITAACAERISHLFWGLPGPEHVAIKQKDEAALKKAIHELEWIGEHATEYMRSIEVMSRLCTSMLNLYDVAAAYSRSRLGIALLSAVEKTLHACTLETEFIGHWHEGIESICKLLHSLQEATPRRWKKAKERIRGLLDSSVMKSYLGRQGDG